MITKKKVLFFYKAWKKELSFKNQVSFERAVFTYFIQELDKILKTFHYPDKRLDDLHYFPFAFEEVEEGHQVQNMLDGEIAGLFLHAYKELKKKEVKDLLETTKNKFREYEKNLIW